MSKSRFLILQDSEEKQVFSVEEHKNGDLTVGLDPYPSVFFQGRRLGSSLGRKISVHVSPLSKPPVHTITHQILLRGRKPHKGFAVVKPAADGSLFWPLMLSAIGRHISAVKPGRIKNKDIVRRLAAFHTNLQTMFMALILCRSGYRFPEAHGLSTVVLDSSHFSLHVLYNFAAVKSSSSSFEVIPYTSRVRDITPEILFEKREAAPSLTVEQVEPFVFSAFCDLAASVQRRNRSLIGTRTGVPLFKRFAEHWNNDEATWDELSYGENSRAGSKINDVASRISPGFKGFHNMVSPPSKPVRLKR